MNKKTVEYVQRNVDDALTRLFYDAKKNDFDKPHYSSVYLCTYKNKLVVLLSKAEFRSNFQTCVELHCPGLTDKSMEFHLENILKKIPRATKEQISYKMSKLKFCSKEHANFWLYQYVTRNFALKCQDYFDNFLAEYLNDVKNCKEYRQIVDIIARKIQRSEDYAGEFETCTLIGDVIRSLGLDLTFEEVNEITEAKKRQIEADKATLAKAREQHNKYANLAKTAKNNGMKQINAAKANELGSLIDIIERRCKVLTK